MILDIGLNEPPEDFDNHVDHLRGTMFYVCQVKICFQQKHSYL